MPERSFPNPYDVLPAVASFDVSSDDVDHGAELGLRHLFDCTGVEPNASDVIFRAIGSDTAPNDAPPTAPPYQKAC